MADRITKRTIKKNTRTSVAQSTKTDSPRSNILNLFVGVIVVILLGIGISLIVRKTGNILPQGAQTQQTQTSIGEQKLYTVQKGDTLWSISEKVYNDGFKWKEIAQANNISNPSQISEGMELKLDSDATNSMISEANPDSATPSTENNSQSTIAPTVIVTVAPTAIETPEPTLEADPMHLQNKINTIDGTSYTVVHGDTLWDIAERAYGDGHKWVDIAKANHLSNPNLIHSGNTFTLPR